MRSLPSSKHPLVKEHCNSATLRGAAAGIAGEAQLSEVMPAGLWSKIESEVAQVPFLCILGCSDPAAQSVILDSYHVHNGKKIPKQ